MSDKKHKHKSKEKDKKKDRDREKDKDEKRNRDAERDSDYHRHHKRKRSRPSRSKSRSRSTSRKRIRSRSKDRIKERYIEQRRSGNRSLDYEQGQSSIHTTKHSENERDRFPEHENRSSTSPEVSRNHDDDNENTTSLVYFSFLDYKSQLSKVLMGYQPRDQIVNDAADFWLFLQKYETLLRNGGRPILPEPKFDAIEVDPNIFHLSLSDRPKHTIKFEDLYRRLSSYDQKKLPERKVRQFLEIVVHYLKFIQKDKCEKIKKLQTMQSELPVAKYKDEIIAAVAREQVVLVAGDTGCGKSTQIPQYLRQAGYENICCTQPRRIACISLSKRVAHEMLCEFTHEVGYQIRFERNKNKDTKIIFLTEGLLLRQLSTEAALTQFDIIVLDEVHERHLFGDFLLGVTKCLLKARPELKLVLMSATINVDLFANYFNEEKVHVIEVPGRLFPIKLHYRPPIEDIAGRQSKAERLSPEPYIQIMQMIDGKYPRKFSYLSKLL